MEIKGLVVLSQEEIAKLEAVVELFERIEEVGNVHFDEDVTYAIKRLQTIINEEEGNIDVYLNTQCDCQCKCFNYCKDEEEYEEEEEFIGYYEDEEYDDDYEEDEEYEENYEEMTEEEKIEEIKKIIQEFIFGE